MWVLTIACPEARSWTDNRRKVTAHVRVLTFAGDEFEHIYWLKTEASCVCVQNLLESENQGGVQEK